MLLMSYDGLSQQITRQLPCRLYNTKIFCVAAEQVAQRTPSLARLVPYCNTQCGACVRDVYKCKLGAKQALPATCQAATKFPQVLSVINECLALRTQGKAC